MILVIDNSCFDTDDETRQKCQTSKRGKRGSSARSIVELVRSLGYKAIRVTTYKKTIELIRHIDITHIVSSGSNLRFSQHTENTEVLLMNTVALAMLPSVPFLGICFGCQMMSYLYGGKIRAMKIGLFDMEVINDFEYGRMNVMSKHSDTIANVGKNGTVLATSIDDPSTVQRVVWSMTHGGVQWHPEFSGDDGKDFIRDFLTVHDESNESDKSDDQ